MDLRRMTMFAAVVDSGSMRAAARSLGLTPSAVSQQIRQLERETGVTLLQCSTRRLALTDAGEAFYGGCAAMVAAAKAAHERLREVHDSVSGDLTISAPVGFAEAHLTRALTPLLSAHPALRLRLVATDDQLDVAKERIDVAISIGTRPPATTLVRRHLATWQNVLVAAPSYLARHGTPRTADQLTQHVFVALPHWHHPADVLTGPGGERYRISTTARITSNNQVTIRQFTLAGCGLSFGVVPEMTEELKAKRLVRVLRHWSAPSLSVDALMLPRVRQPAKVRAALEALLKHLAGRDAT
jgi:DNA-binding transcriptional LysR family regulator